MSKKMDAVIFIDETGDVLNPDDQRHFGFGFCYCPREIVPALEDLLKNAELDLLHFTRGSYDENLRLAKKLASLELDKLGLRCGVMIEPDTRYEKLQLNHVAGQILSAPMVFLGVLDRDSRSRHLKNKKILTIKDLLPGVYSGRRLATYLCLLARFSVMPALRQFGESLDSVELLISSVSEHNSYVKKVRQTQVDMVEQALTFFEKMHREGILKSNPRLHMGMEVKIVEKSDGLFGVADFVGAVGNHIFRGEKDRTHGVGQELYEILSPLFCDFGMDKREIKPGVALFYDE
ncbi:MAG: hypothetical protein ACXVCG_01530 [Bdellovibrionota bacterium]